MKCGRSIDDDKNFCPKSGLAADGLSIDIINENYVDFAFNFASEDDKPLNQDIHKHYFECEDCQKAIDYWVFIFENSNNVFQQLQRKGVLDLLQKEKEDAEEEE